MNLFKELIHDMGQFIDSISAQIAEIHGTAGVDAQVTTDVNAALATALAPIEAAQTTTNATLATQATAISTAQATITDLETAITSIVTNLNAGNVAAATEAATSATAAVATASTVLANATAAASTGGAATDTAANTNAAGNAS